MERIIVDDPIFGKLSYHKKLSNDYTFSTENYFCRNPFMYNEIRMSGEIFICCPQRNPASIGNILNDSLQNIWASEKAQIIRETVFDGSFKYCNSETCSVLRRGDQEGGLLLKNEKNLQILRSHKSTTPTQVLFVVDNSCNLSCPSCRLKKISQLDSFYKPQGLTVIRKTLRDMFFESHNEYKLIGMDGSGEVFNSEVYREVFETEDLFTKTHLWPNVKFTLSTNGTMMTTKIQQKYKSFFDHIEWIEISVDAGNEESYNKVRVGGNWKLLWKNIDYFYSTMKSNKNVRWVWNIIAQKNNYKSIPELINIANKFTEKKPVINIARVLNWGTWSEEEYLNHAVHLPSHPEHEEYLEIINSPLVKNYKNY